MHIVDNNKTETTIRTSATTKTNKLNKQTPLGIFPPVQHVMTWPPCYACDTLACDTPSFLLISVRHCSVRGH